MIFTHFPTSGFDILDYFGKTKIYGMHVDMTKSNPAEIISYEVEYEGEPVDNYDYTPAHVDLSTGVLDSGDWNMIDDFIIPKSCMLNYDGTVAYYLDEDDETKKVDGTASDVANADFGGNAMMEWGRNGQRIYMKIVPDDVVTKGMTVYISNKRLDNGFTDYSFYDCDGNEINHFYTPKYNGSLVNSKLRSLSGRSIMNGQAGASEINYALANNTKTGKTEWYIENWGDRTLINMLLLMLGKNTNTQAVWGNGYTSGGSAAGSLKATGTANGKGMFYGTSSNNTVKVFGMEHYWGNQWRRMAGLLSMNGTVKYKMSWSTVDGTTQTGYDATGSGYKTVVNCTPGGTSGGYVSGVVCTEDGVFLKTASGSESTYMCDGLWFNNSGASYMLVGGTCGDRALCGAFYGDLYCALSAAGWSIGAALSCKPLAA